MWHVYLVECADGTLYCGVATDVSRRVATHEAGRGARYTRGRGPLRLLWTEAHATRADAQRREAEVKGMSRAQKLWLVARGRVVQSSM